MKNQLSFSKRRFKTSGKLPQYPLSHHIGLCLRRLREIQKLSQSELSRRAGINLSYISSVENHPSNISINKLLQLCNGMSVPGWLSLRLATIESERRNMRAQTIASWQEIKMDFQPGILRVADQPGS